MRLVSSPVAIGLPVGHSHCQIRSLRKQLCWRPILQTRRLRSKEVKGFSKITHQASPLGQAVLSCMLDPERTKTGPVKKHEVSLWNGVETEREGEKESTGE